MPQLTDDEVDRFVALGEFGEDLFGAGKLERAKEAFLAQIDIFSLNSQPFVSLALLEASRGERDAAMEYLRAGVARGFRRIRELQRSEVWRTNLRTADLTELEQSVVVIDRHERDWPAWRTFQAPHVPDRVAVITDKRAELLGRIEAMSPALGPRQTRLWTRLIDRAAASMYETYIRRHPGADDLGPAFDRLLELYAGGPLGRWDRLPPEVAQRLERTATAVMRRSPDESSRSRALLAAALAANADRDGRGRLREPSIERIRTTLDELLARHAESSICAVAMVGRIRVELESGHRERAEELWALFDGDASPSPPCWREARLQLGGLALTLGGLPSFRSTSLEGEIVDATSLAGKIVLIDFWATWCAPCLEELPTLRRIERRFPDEVTVVGINMDWSEDVSPSELREWTIRHEVPGVQLHDGLGWDSELVRAFGVTEIPFVVVVGADGAVIAVGRHGKELEKTVKTAVRRGSSREPDAPPISDKLGREVPPR